MEKSIAYIDDTLTRFTEGQKRPSSGTASRQKHRSRSRHRNHYSYYRRSHSQSPQRLSKSNMVISTAVDHPPQTSHLVPRNQKLMTNMRNAPNTGMKMKRMSNRIMVTMRMWETRLVKTSKHMCHCLLQGVQTLQNQIC